MARLVHDDIIAQVIEEHVLPKVHLVARGRRVEVEREALEVVARAFVAYKDVIWPRRRADALVLCAPFMAHAYERHLASRARVSEVKVVRQDTAQHVAHLSTDEITVMAISSSFSVFCLPHNGCQHGLVAVRGAWHRACKQRTDGSCGRHGGV